MNYTNIYALFRERIAEYAGRDVFYVRHEGEWRGSSWEKFGEDAHAFASALLASGLTRGASVCVLMGNVPEWPVCDVGTIAAGGVGCGLYTTSSAEQCAYIIKHSDAEFVVVDT
ncbi:MAG: AMP-binding protein, partial [Pyrinomonadaceae bacterium]